LPVSTCCRFSSSDGGRGRSRRGRPSCTGSSDAAGWAGARAIGFDHHQAGVLDELLRLDLRRLVTGLFAARLFVSRLLVPGLHVARLLVTGLFVARFLMTRLRVHRLGMLRLLLAL
jgi:hypothetical protein